MIRRRHVRYVQQRRWCDRIAFHRLGVGVAAYTKSDSRHTTRVSSGTLSRRVLYRNVIRLVNSGGFRIFRWNWRRRSDYGRSNRPVDKMARIAQTTSPSRLLRRAITRIEESGRRFLGFLPPALFRYLIDSFPAVIWCLCFCGSWLGLWRGASAHIVRSFEETRRACHLEISTLKLDFFRGLKFGFLILQLSNFTSVLCYLVGFLWNYAMWISSPWEGDKFFW